MLGDLGLIDSHKLSAELGNFTRPLREDTEGRVTLGSLDGRGKSSEEKTAFCRPHQRGPGVRLWPSSGMSHLHLLGSIMLPAVWWGLRSLHRRQQDGSGPAEWQQGKPLCWQYAWKYRGGSHPAKRHWAHEAGKTWPSLPAKRCQQRCVPLDAMFEGPRTKIAVPRLGQELPSCVPSHGDPNLGPGEGLSQPECAGFHTREDTLHHAVKLMERWELKHWMHYHEVMGLDAMILVFWMLSFKPTFSLSSFTFIISWQIDLEKVETVTGFIFLGSKITVDSDCSHEIKRCLFLGRKAMTNLDSVIKKQRHHFANKGLYSQSYGFSSSHV